MKIKDMLSEREFIRIVEVFPPSFSIHESQEPEPSFKQKVRNFIERVRLVSRYADGILISDVKDATRAKVSTIFAAYLLKKEIGCYAIPVITARDSNKQQLRSMLATLLPMEIDGVMLVWGDKFEHKEAKNVHDYNSLSELIREARNIFKRESKEIDILAPVNILRLSEEDGIRLAKERLDSGSDLLLAQPPTPDMNSLSFHESLLRNASLSSRVLLNAFPFRDRQDVIQCRQRFAWEISSELEEIASKGEAELLRHLNSVVKKMYESGAAGVYVSTRGRPEIARYVLE